MVKLWLVARSGKWVDYDEFDSQVIAHLTAGEAVKASCVSIYSKEDGFSVRCVGIAADDIKVGDSICESFNAG